MRQSDSYGFNLVNNYKLLPALASLLETKNLTESAKRLNVTQSAMSKTLTQIREAFGDAILVRQANHFVLTSRARQLQMQLPDLMNQLDGLYLAKTLDLTKCSRCFHFASSDYVAQVEFPLIGQQVFTKAPNASVEYHVWQKDLLPYLADKPFDIVSTIADEIPENLYGKMIAKDEHVCVIRKSHPLANTHWQLEDYVAAKHILVTGGGDKDSVVDNALAKMQLKRDIFARMPFFQGAIELLKSTDVVLTTPLHIAAEFAQDYELQLHPLPLTIKSHDYYLLWHAKHHLDVEHQWFRELCIAVLTKTLNDSIARGMKLIHAN